MTSNTHMVHVTIVSTTMTSSQMTALVPSLSLLSNSFSFPLDNVFDCISVDDLPRIRPVMEVVSPIAHDDVHSERVERSHPTSQEDVEIPMVDDVTATLDVDVEHNHSTPREMMESPKGSHEHVPHSSIVEHDDVHEVSMESIQVPVTLKTGKGCIILILLNQKQRFRSWIQEAGVFLFFFIHFFF